MSAKLVVAEQNPIGKGATTGVFAKLACVRGGQPVYVDYAVARVDPVQAEGGPWGADASTLTMVIAGELKDADSIQLTASVNVEHTQVEWSWLKIIAQPVDHVQPAAA